MRRAFPSYLDSGQQQLPGQTGRRGAVRVRTWRCRCSRRAKSRLQCGQGRVLFFAPVAFLLRRPPVEGVPSIVTSAICYLNSEYGVVFLPVERAERGNGVRGDFQEVRVAVT
jgi:hypothetical protein